MMGHSAAPHSAALRVFLPASTRSPVRHVHRQAREEAEALMAAKAAWECFPMA